MKQFKKQNSKCNLQIMLIEVISLTLLTTGL